MATVTLTNLVKNYGKIEVLHTINAAICDGEFIVIVGPSGCGKSTLLRLIAGLEEVTAGEVHINGSIVNTVEPKDRKIAMVFQNYALYPHMTVYQNMAYGLKLRKHKKHEIQRRVEEAAQMLQLQELLDRKPRQLSGGQRQRVAMGRALVRKPEVFLFDEPLSNLDAKLRHQMRGQLQHLHKKLQTTMIYVTHDQVEAMTLADRIILLHQGRIAQFGTPAELYNNPVSTFVAEFMGSPPMNIMPAELDPQGLLHFHGGGSVPLQNTSNLPPGQILVGLRPENLKIVAQPENQQGLSITIDFVEHLGAGSIVYAQHGSRTVAITMKKSTQSQHGRYAAVFEEKNVHFFDSQTGKSL